MTTDEAGSTRSRQTLHYVGIVGYTQTHRRRSVIFQAAVVIFYLSLYLREAFG